MLQRIELKVLSVVRFTLTLGYVIRYDCRMSKLNHVTSSGKIVRSYRKWSSMLRRCYDPGHPAWKYYAEQGIRVCERWSCKEGYDNFLADMGEPPEGLTLGRIDNTKGYSPENCRWETWKQQAQNRRTKRTNPNSLRQKAIAAGLPYHTVYQRIQWGWSEEQALKTPLMAPGYHFADRGRA